MKNPPKNNEKEKDQLKSDSKDFSEKKSSSNVINTSRSKKILKSKENSLSLQTIIGLTCNSHNNMAMNSLSGEIAYPAGSMLVIYNPITNKQSKFIFSPNKKPFTCVTYSKDGKFLIAGEGICKNPEINIWDLRHDNPPICLKGHKFGIEKILFSPNNNYLISIGDENDKGLFVWDWEKEVKLSMNKLSKKIIAATFNQSGTLLVTAGVQHLKFWPFDNNGKVILVKPKETENVFIIEGKSAILGQKFQNKTFTDVCTLDTSVFALDSEGILCVLSEQRKLEKWMDLKVQTAFTLQITSNYIICGCSDGIIRFFDTKTLHHITTLPKPPALGSYNVEKEKGTIRTSNVFNSGPEIFADVIALLVDEIRSRLIALYSDKTLFIWDIHDLQKINIKRSFLSHSGTIYDLQTLENSSYEVTFFASGSVDQTIRIWNLLDEEKGMPNLPGLRRNHYSKNLTKILYLGQNFEHFKYRKDDAEKPSANQVRCLKCSHDGQYLASGDLDGVLRIFSLITFSKISEVVSHDQEILCLDFTPENPLECFLLATGSRDRLIHIYDGNDEFKLLTTLEEHNSSISALQFAFHKTKKSILLMSCGVDKTLIFREYKPKETKPFLQIHLEIDKISKFFTLDLNHETNIAVLGQEKKLQLWSIDEMRVKGTIETKDEDKATGKMVPLDNLKISVDSSGTYIAVSNNDKIVRIRDFNTGSLVAKISCGDIITSLAFTQNSKYLITASSKGCIYIWKLSNEIKSNIEKKKQQLGILAKRFKEMLGKSKDLTLDSFWIEEEIKQFLKKEENNNNNNNSMNLLLNELEKNESKGNFKKVPTELNKNKNDNVDMRPKELFQKPEEIVLDFVSETSKFNNNNNPELPSWTQSNIKNIVNNQELPSWAQSNILQKKEEDLVLNNFLPKWLENPKEEKNEPNILLETDFIEVDIDKDAPTNTQTNQLIEPEEEKDNEIYQKPERETTTQIEETDPFVKKNYFDLDRQQISSPLRSSLTSIFLKEHSQKKENQRFFNNNQEDIFISNEGENNNINNNGDNNNENIIIESNYEEVDVAKKLFNDETIQISVNQTTEQGQKKEPNIVPFIRNPKTDKKQSFLNLTEISEQMQMINKNIEKLQFNLGKNENSQNIFESQVEVRDLDNYEQNLPKIKKNLEIFTVEKSQLVQRSRDSIINQNNEVIIEDQIDNDIEEIIINESKKQREKMKENNENENFHETILQTLSPLKEKILTTEQNFESSRLFSPLKKKQEEKTSELELRMDEFFHTFERNLNNFKEDIEDMLEKEKNESYRTKIFGILEKKIESSKSQLDSLINKKSHKESNLILLKGLDLENSNLNINPEISQINKSISNYLVDQSRDLLEIYSKELINMIKNSMGRNQNS